MPKGLVQLACHLARAGRHRDLVWSTRGTLWLVPAMVGHGILLVSCSRRCTSRSIGPRFAAAAQRRRGVGVRRAPDPAARVFPCLPLRPSSPHPGPGARPELAAPKPRTLWRLSPARLGAAVLARADHHHGPACAWPRVESPSSRRARGRGSCARRGCCSRVYLLAGLASIAWMSPALLYLLGRARAPWPAVPAAVSARRAHRLPVGRRACWRTRGPRAAWRRSAGSPGTCRITPSTTPVRRCRSTPCRRRTSS